MKRKYSIYSNLNKNQEPFFYGGYRRIDHVNRVSNKIKYLFGNSTKVVIVKNW